MDMAHRLSGMMPGKTGFCIMVFSRSAPENGRILLLDQIKWDKEGWPYVEGEAPSYETQKAPVFNN